MEFDGLIVSDALDMRGVLAAGDRTGGRDARDRGRMRPAARAHRGGRTVAHALDDAVQRGELDQDACATPWSGATAGRTWARPDAGREPSLDDEMWSRQTADTTVHLVRGAIPRVGTRWKS